MSKWKRKNKTSEVLEHLKKYKAITSTEAIEKFGATRLSAIIYNLRNNYGLSIVTFDVPFTDRYGTKTSCAKYVLMSNVEDINV